MKAASFLALPALAAASLSIPLSRSAPQRADARRLGDADQTISNSWNTMYFGNIRLGTPGQYFDVQFDAGSANVFVPTVECETAHPHLYDAAASSTAARNGSEFDLQFVQWGLAEGTLEYDSLTIGDVTLPDVMFGAVSEYSGMLNRTAFDGKVGLGMAPIARGGAPTVLQLLYDAGEIDSLQWSFLIDGTPTSPGGFQKDAGSLVFGTPEGVQWDDTWPITDDAEFYQVAGDSLALGDDVLLEGETMGPVLFDTGTPGLLLPPSAADAINAKLGCEMVDWPDWTPQVCAWEACPPTDEFETLWFTFADGAAYGLKGEQLVLDMGADAASGMGCISVVQGVDFGDQSSLVGDAFLRGLDTNFNLGEWTVSLAAKEGGSVVRRSYQG